MTKITRNYGNERNMGDILEKDGSKFVTIDAGFFRKSIGMKKGDNHEGYDITTRNFKTGEDVVIGRTFPKKDKEGNTLDFVQQVTLGLFTSYDKELKKSVQDHRDAIFLEIVFLKEPETLKGDLTKVGFVKGRIGVEVASTES
jgi:hypothetical protein